MKKPDKMAVASIDDTDHLVHLPYLITLHCTNVHMLLAFVLLSGHMGHDVRKSNFVACK